MSDPATQSASPVSAPDQNKIKKIVTDGVLKVNQLPAVYDEFKKEIDPNGLQTSDGTKTGKGYDTLGYGYAWITERLNDVVGPNCWRMVLEEMKPTQEEVGKVGEKKLMHAVAMDVHLELGNWINVERQEVLEQLEPDAEFKASVTNRKITTTTTPEFQALAKAVGFGWHRAFALADARKGSMTNGLKKAAAFFGIGNEAYKKTIDEENQDVKDVLEKKDKKKGAQKQAVETAFTDRMKELNEWMERRGFKTDAQKIAIANELGFDSGNKWGGFNPKQISLLMVRTKIANDRYPISK